jgi:hypothetical protein
MLRTRNEGVVLKWEYIRVIVGVVLEYQASFVGGVV